MTRLNTDKIDRILSIDQGKIPPQDIMIEGAVLGALLNDGDSIVNIIDILKPESFYKDEHQKIYTSISNLAKSNKNIDILSVQDELKKSNLLEEIGGFLYLSQLMSGITSAYNIIQHALIIQQKFIQRELIRISSEIQNRAFDDSIDVKDLIDYSETEIFNVSQNNITSEAIRSDVIMNDEINIINKLTAKEIKFTGIASGFSQLDRLTGGWQKPNLILMSARPSMGKSALMLYFAKFPVISKIPVAIFSLEMSKEELVRRLLSYDTGINSMNMVQGNLSNKELQQMEGTLAKFTNLPLYIDDTPSLSISDFNARIRRYCMKYGIKLALVDYLQLMKGEKGGNREQEISSISRGLKASAKKNDIPIIALAQLSRAVETRGSKRPMLSDLRESGSLEQDADMVMFIHRPEKYGEEFIQTDQGKIDTKGLIDLIIAKYRNGKQGDVLFWSNDSFTTFREEKEEITPF